MFRRWVDNENIDYLNFPKRKLTRPTYRYCSYLYCQIDSGRIARNTAKRRMSSVQGFYRWLQDIQNIDFGQRLWQEREVLIHYSNQRGFNRLKKQTTTDQSIKVPQNRDYYSEYLQDGGKLRPLLKEEQCAVIKALQSIGNTEMTLAFLIALTSGARLQTIFTLRLCHFSDILSESLIEKIIKVGMGTLINTKNNKQMVIRIPSWLYRKMCIYLSSPRAIRRRKMSKYIYENDQHQYAFLTRNGFPYYISDTDPFIFQFRNPPRGIAISNFIKQQLRPMLKRNGCDFAIKFHDLRATFGMNLLEDKMQNMVCFRQHLVTNTIFSYRSLSST